MSYTKSEIDLVLHDLLIMHSNLISDIETHIKAKFCEILEPLFDIKDNLHCVYWDFSTKGLSNMVGGIHVEYTKNGKIIEKNINDLGKKWFVTNSFDDLKELFNNKKILNICYQLFANKRIIVTRDSTVIVEDLY